MHAAEEDEAVPDAGEAQGARVEVWLREMTKMRPTPDEPISGTEAGGILSDVVDRDP
jgi:hypothetical protein